MALEKEVMQKMKEAMKAKDTLALASLRSIKSEILKAKTATAATCSLPSLAIQNMSIRRKLL